MIHFLLVYPSHVLSYDRRGCARDMPGSASWPIGKTPFLKSRRQTRYLWGTKRSTVVYSALGRLKQPSLLFDAGSLTIGQFRLRHIRLSAVFSRNPFSLAMRTVIPLLSPLRHQIHAINVSWMTLGPSFWSQLLPFPLVKHFRLYLCCCFPPTYSSSPLMENIYENNIHNNTTPTNARGVAIYIVGAVVHTHNPRLQHSQPC